MCWMMDEVDRTREQAGFWGVRALVEGPGTRNILLEPYSILISRRVEIGRGNRVYPGTVIECDDESEIRVGDGNLFLPGCCLRAIGGGSIAIGDRNRFGEGGFTAAAHDAAIVIGHGGRYMLGASIGAGTRLGDGSQVLGPIALQGCTLGAGGTHDEPDPDRRGGVLKGQGRARGLTIARGEVILGKGGDLQMSALQRQSHFHPRPG